MIRIARILLLSFTELIFLDIHFYPKTALFSLIIHMYSLFNIISFIIKSFSVNLSYFYQVCYSTLIKIKTRVDGTFLKPFQA